MKKNFNINPPLEMSEVMGKMCKAMKKTLAASEKLSKPYVSDAQRKKFHAMENRGEISHATVHEFDEASKGKHLPEHVAKARVEEFKTPREKMHIREKRTETKPEVKPELAPHTTSLHAIKQVMNNVPHTKDARSGLNDAAHDAKWHAAQTQHARIKHEQKMPKPKLTRSELEKFDQEVGNHMAKARVEEFKTPREKMHIREKRTETKPKPALAPHVTSANAIQHVIETVPHTKDTQANLRDAASDAKWHARNTQSARLRHEQKMPKPKLTRSELEKFDQEVGNHMAKAAGAPGQMPKPALAKLPQPNLKQPTAKLPSIKSPAMKAPTMKQPQMQKADIVRPDAGYGKTTVKDTAPPPTTGKVIMKDDMPHPPGSPEERSHAVAEHMTSLPNALKDVRGQAAKKKFFDHLRSLKSAKDMRSPENVLTPKKVKI